MKTLIIGSNGQVGTELKLQAQKFSTVELYTSSRSEIPSDEHHFKLDLTDESRLRNIIKELKPDVIINASAYTAVDKAESEPDLAMMINAKAPAVMAEEAKKIGAWLVHYSTDYVFDGSGDQARDELAPTKPLNTYGKTKLAGELAIQDSGCDHTIFRTSWVFSAHGHNFVKTMLRLGSEKEELSIVDDQIGSPTSARLIAEITWRLIHDQNRDQWRGLYHLCCDGVTSWHGFAEEIFRQAKELGISTKVVNISPVPSTSFLTAAKRPANSRLNCARLETTLSSSLTNWRNELNNTLRQLNESI